MSRRSSISTDAAPSTRATALDAVAARPGASTAIVASTLGVDHSTAAYHLRRLERAGSIASVVTGRERRHYVKGTPLCPFLRAVAPIVERSACRVVLRAIDTENKPRAADIARVHGLSVQRTRWATELLERAGLVSRAPGGRFSIAADASACMPHVFDASPCGRWGRCAVSASPWIGSVIGEDSRRPAFTVRTRHARAIANPRLL